MKTIKIYDVRMQNYIEERGIKPLYEVGNATVYERTKKLISLLESYEIFRCAFRKGV